MDCNSYSYAPHMLDEKHFLYYGNADMYIEVDKDRAYDKIIFWLYACSYDGQFEVAERIDDEKTARELFNYIKDNYSDTPPDNDELNSYVLSIINRAAI